MAGVLVRTDVSNVLTTTMGSSGKIWKDFAGHGAMSIIKVQSSRFIFLFLSFSTNFLCQNIDIGISDSDYTYTVKTRSGELTTV